MRGRGGRRGTKTIFSLLGSAFTRRTSFFLAPTLGQCDVSHSHACLENNGKAYVEYENDSEIKQKTVIKLYTGCFHFLGGGLPQNHLLN